MARKHKCMNACTIHRTLFLNTQVYFMYAKVSTSAWVMLIMKCTKIIIMFILMPHIKDNEYIIKLNIIKIIFKHHVLALLCNTVTTLTVTTQQCVIHEVYLFTYTMCYLPSYMFQCFFSSGHTQKLFKNYCYYHQTKHISVIIHIQGKMLKVSV